MGMQILADMDGVIVDFVSAALAAHGRNEPHDSVTTWDFWKDQWGMSSSEFWSKCRGYDFWFGLKPYPWAKEFYESLKSLGEVTITTAPSMDPDCIRAKIDWLNHHLGVHPSDVMCGQKKWLMARNGLLIDDSPENCLQFKLKKGSVVMFPQPWNAGSSLRSEKVGNAWDVIDRARHAKEYLDRFM